MKVRYLFFPILLTALWAGCQGDNKNALTEEEQAKYTRTGQDIVQNVATVITTAVTKSLNDGGVGRAAQYCSYIAIPMVDTLAANHGVKIRRTSDKIRNPKDAPTEREREVIEQFKQEKTAGKELKPLVEAIDPHTVAYYQPILIQPLCLTCHGVLGETMTEENYGFIKYLYPDDQAIGYALGDVRGIFSLQIPR
jgi:hypothetical protein